MSASLEESIRELIDAEDFGAAATLALEGYGGEIFSFLVTTMRSEGDAADVFSQVCEDMWRGLPNFAWRCSFRTWLYTLARHATARFRRTPHNQRRRHVGTSNLLEIADRVRSSTMTHLRTDVVDAFADLRRQLDPDEQMLLVLRVDRQLSWKEVARVLSDDDDPSDSELTRDSGRIRKKFQAMKDRLRTRADELGLLRQR